MCMKNSFFLNIYRIKFIFRFAVTNLTKPLFSFQRFRNPLQMDIQRFREMRLYELICGIHMKFNYSSWNEEKNQFTKRHKASSLHRITFEADSKYELWQYFCAFFRIKHICINFRKYFLKFTQTFCWKMVPFLSSEFHK